MGLIKKFADYAGVKHEIDPTGHSHTTSEGWLSTIVNNLTTLINGKAASNHTHSTSESWLSTIVNNLTTLINGKEDSTNKVNLLSDQSTNTQYPGALCVYNAINSYVPSSISYCDETGKWAEFDCHESTTYALMMVNSGGEGENEIIGSISIDIDNNEAIITADADKIEGTAVTDSLSSTATTEKKIPTSGAVKAALNGKANVSTTLAGYGITNAYTKTEVDTALAGKEDTSNKVTAWSQQLSDTKYPSEKLVRQSLFEKADYDSPHLVNEVVVSGSIELKDEGDIPAELKVPSFSDINDGTNNLQSVLNDLESRISKGTDSIGSSVVCVKNSLSGFIILTINGTELSIDQTRLQKLAQLLA